MTETRRPSSALSQARPKLSVVNYVLDRIKEAIVQGELKPGDVLPSEAELTASLGVGKTSIREAVKMLQAVGAVESRQGHGTVIRREPGPDMLSPLVFQLLLKDGTPSELLEFRQLFEPSYTLLAMEKATDDDIARLGETVDRLEENIANGVQSVEDDLAFHRVILEATRNPYMINIGNTLMELFRSSIERSLREIPHIAAEDHRAIFTAFEARDRNALAAAVAQSYEGWARSLSAEKAEAEAEAEASRSGPEDQAGEILASGGTTGIRGRRTSREASDSGDLPVSKRSRSRGRLKRTSANAPTGKTRADHRD